MTLLEIGDGVKALQDLLEQDGEIPAEFERVIEAWFDELGDAQEQKLDAYVSIIREHQLRASVRKEEQERLAMRVRADENVAKRLKDRLKLYLELTGQRKVETRRYKISIANNGGKVPVEIKCHPSELPPAYQRTVIEADMDAIRNDLDRGEEVEGASLGVRGNHLRIA